MDCTTYRSKNGICASAGWIFYKGSTENDNSASDNEKPQITHRLEDFWIGKTPVTVSEYVAFSVDNNNIYRNDDEERTVVARHEMYLEMFGGPGTKSSASVGCYRLVESNGQLPLGQYKTCPGTLELIIACYLH